MNFKLKCLICKTYKLFKWGKFCKNCLKENDACFAGPYNTTLCGKELGTTEYLTYNKEDNYMEVPSDTTR